MSNIILSAMNTPFSIPDNENSRLKALEEYNILDTAPEYEFDRLTELASLICSTPISLISLIDKERQWFKSKVGLDATETHRNISFCQHAIKGSTVFEIADASTDERFKNNPFVSGDPNIRFYAGHPLIDNKGFALGTLCVIDDKPRKLNEEQLKALTLLAEEVMSQIIARKEREQLNDYMLLFKTSVDMVCIAGADGFFKKINPAFTDTLEWSEEELLKNSFFELIHPDDLNTTLEEIKHIQEGIRTVNFTIRFRKKSGEYVTLQWTANAGNANGKIYAIGRDVTEEKKNETELHDYAELFKTTTDMVCLSSSDGFFKKVNPAFTSILGWSEEELLKEPYAKLIHPDDLPRTINEVKKLRDGIKSYSFINRLLTKNGDYRTVQWASNPSKISGFTYAIARDITDIIKNEEELKNTLYEVSQLQHAIDEAAIVSKTDQDFKVTYVNDKFCEISGYTREELLGLDQVKHSSGYHTKEFLTSILETVTAGKIWKGQVKSRKKNGEDYWVDTTAVPLVKDGNKPHGYITIRYDITLQKRIEEEIRKLAELQGAILDGTNYSIIATKPDGTIITFNKGAEEMLGYSEIEVTNQKNLAFIHDEEELQRRAEVLRNELNITIESDFETLVVKSRLEKPDVNEWTYIKKDGHKITVMLTVTTLFDSKKNITGYLGIARDITETKRSQELLRRSEEKLRLFFENTQGLMCTHDRNGTFLSMNVAGAALIGYSEKELIAKNLFDVVPQKTWGEVKLYLKRIFAKGSDEGLMRVMHKNGTIKVWLYKNILVKDTNGEDIVIGNAIDISDRIKAEKQLEKAKLLAEQSVHAKDQFLANMSHEIRTPMNAILGFSDVLKSTLLDEKQKQYVDAIGNSGENLIVIINDILDFSKIESGNLTLENKATSIRDVLNHVKNLLTFKAQEKNIELNLYIDEKVPNYVLADKVRLNQIFTNLVGNAIKFTEVGKVDIFCHAVSYEENNCTLKFRIVDTGIGIPQDKIEIIFERFKQAEDNTTRKFGGTGLGLSITKKLVEIFKGSIHVSSLLDKGSEFTVELPFKITEQALEQNKIQNKLPLPQGVINVLVTEDNPLNQKLAKHILESNNCIVEIANDGQKAVEILKTKRFDVILMDLQMPVMDGYVATSFIRNVLKLNTPIIAMTAHSLLGEEEKCLKAGMNDYLSKPYKAADLLEVIHSLVEHEAREEQAKSILDSRVNADYDLTDLIELSNKDEAFVQEMVRVFIQEIGDELNKIKEFVEHKQISEVKKIAHKIKSSFTLFRMPILTELAKNLEIEKDDSKIQRQVEELIEKTKRIVISISKELKM